MSVYLKYVTVVTASSTITMTSVSYYVTIVKPRHTYLIVTDYDIVFFCKKLIIMVQQMATNGYDY